MPNLKTIKKILDVGLVPVVRATSADEAIAIVEAITAGGVSVLEITMTVPGAIKAIEKVADRYGKEVLVGAGTVLSESPLRVTGAGYREAGRLLGELGLPTVLVQEGGYELDTIGPLVEGTLAGFEEG